MANRLADATSPYLLQHADNPVHWWEWSSEAFDEARRTDRPILLSVGYAACHWCHVMAHESFEDQATADYLNEHFVSIKVDREERPDVDAIYMQATQAMTGQGGWPMTVALTPTGEPFFAGTYFPPEPRQGMPAFTQILQGLNDAWRSRRDEVVEIAADITDHMSQTIASSNPVDADELSMAVQRLKQDFDVQNGGFGGAPKFPPSMMLEFCLRHHARTGDATAWDMVARTCDAMARGGLYDQLGGGFARYSVDSQWIVPHFEKMLYDNAQLLRVYLHRWRVDADPLAQRVARETAHFMLRELRTPEGGFASALDADSDGHEGTFYVWNPNQLMRALGVGDGAWATALLSVTGPGTFERGYSTLQLLQDPDDDQRWESVRERLLTERAKRTRPARDDKVVTAWNAMAITALLEAGILLEEPEFTAAAVGAAELLWSTHVVDGKVRRVSRDGVVGQPDGVLEDHGALVEAFVAVLGSTGDPVWLQRATVVADRIIEQFADPQGGFFDTAADAETLVVRPQDPSDNAYPSGASAAAHGLIALSAVTGEHRYRAAAQAAVSAAAELVRRVPRFAGWSAAAAEALLVGPEQIAIVGPDRSDMHRAALMRTSAGAVIVSAETASDEIPLLAGRTAQAGVATAYVCHDFTCDLPTTNPRDLWS